MGLPFLKRKDEAAGSNSTPVQMREPDEDVEYDAMHAAASDLKQALDDGNVPAIAEALRAAFDLHKGDQDGE